ncbi:MAG: DUF4136 domain-containing protein, partial [Gemmatimonadota bacterium]
RTFAPVLAAIVIPACSSKSASVDFDDNYSFSGKDTYAWLDASGQRGTGNDMTHRRVVRSVDAALAERGFRQVPLESAALAVAYHVSAEDQRVYDTYGYGTGRWSAYEGTTTTERVFTEGSLTIDLFDTARKELVWRGTASETIDPSASPEQRDEIVARAVRDMFDGFPPGS